LPFRSMLPQRAGHAALVRLQRTAVSGVPVRGLPPGAPLILQVTAVFVVLLTVAANASELPSRIEEPVSEMLTVIEAGGKAGEGAAASASNRNPATKR